MRIGDLAARAEVNIQTLRFYEREGLLRRPLRTASGYRCYEQCDLDRVRFIRLCQGLGFTLREVGQLLHLHARIAESRGAKKMEPEAVSEILEIAGERIAIIDRKISELTTMRADLASLLHALTPGASAACPVPHEQHPR
jgi:MerR family copper efflux transcriptional regulator